MKVYGISLQNEPAFVEPYASCVYTAEEYRELVKVAGPIIHGQFPNVKMFGAEDMLSRWSVPGSFPGPLMTDPLSREHMNALAVHGYSDGVHPTPASDAVTKWSLAARNCAGVGKPLWMTETSGYLHSDWGDCLHLAEMMYAALKYGKITVWTWWQLSEQPHSNPSDDRFALMLHGNGTKLYYVSKQYYRYIRPGAVQIGSSSDDGSVYVTAFHHAADRTLTLVLINAASSTKAVSVTGGATSYTAYRTSAGEDCRSVGTVSAGSVSLPASSVTTLVASNYTTRIIPSRRATARVRASHTATAYTLDGRLSVPRVGKRSALRSAGVLVVRSGRRASGSVRGLVVSEL
jgi:O-glycosyl hydrolase